MLQLIGILGAGIPAVLTSILAMMARKWGTTTATIALFIFLTGAFISCINMLMSQLLYLLSPPAAVSIALGMFIPTNFAMVLSTIVSSKICRAAYDMAMDKAKAFGSAS